MIMLKNVLRIKITRSIQYYTRRYLELRNLGSQFRAFEFMDVERQTLALQVVPLPEFTRNRIPQQDKSKKKIS
ncbi:uncharacterized protein OCT59_015489 [Rhizophagus irregularis]|uniref:Uncharacterized protein n=1 Tax=Rhizophagus irregularis TaxID=588596 RepID=A0A916EHV6_9GLOM|nr:hypothetical protein OCT59_015489 [Rhizophagus irregularis]CAB5370466.1 unnamed protein product [Rhizophagus irregularis]CAB5389541.1 unnamed protein product [Rhizophagus irregularis]